MKIKWLLKHLYTSPTSPPGRKMRIQHLVEKGEVTRESATLTVYSRDFDRGFTLTDEEEQNLKNIIKKYYPNWRY